MLYLYHWQKIYTGRLVSKGKHSTHTHIFVIDMKSLEIIYRCGIYHLKVSNLAMSCNDLIVLAAWINHLPPACWSTFWKSTFKQQLGCRFDILDSISYFLYFDICNYTCFDTSYHFSALCLLLKYCFYIFSSTPVPSFSINLIFILSIDLKIGMTWTFSSKQIQAELYSETG